MKSSADTDPHWAPIAAALAEVGASAIDIGCGQGQLAGRVARRSNGRLVVGVDPNPAVISDAMMTQPAARFAVSGAEALPFGEDRFDLALFINSLHHVPVPLMGTALREAVRVVRDGGRLIVREPLARGAVFDLFAPIDDETEIRAEAASALADLAATGELGVLVDTIYSAPTVYRGVEECLQHAITVEPGRAEKAAEQRDEVEARYRRLAEPGPDGDRFSGEYRVVVFAVG